MYEEDGGRKRENAGPSTEKRIEAKYRQEKYEHENSASSGFSVDEMSQFET